MKLATVDGVLNWSEVAEAVSYRVQVSTDSLFRNGIVVDTTVTDTNWEVSLEPGTYGWRVYAFDGTVRSPWSEVWPFEVIFPVTGEESPETEEALVLAVRPNPASGLVEVELSVRNATEVSVLVFDARGRQVAVLDEGPVPVGTHALRWDSSGAAPGVYLIRAETDEATVSRSVTIAR